MSAGKPDGILTGRFLVDLALSSLFLPPSPVLLSQKRVESASHILENCWGHLTSWQNTFPRIRGTWSRVPLRATLSESISVSLPPPPSFSHPFTAASFYRPLCLLLLSLFSDARARALSLSLSLSHSCSLILIFFSVFRSYI